MTYGALNVGQLKKVLDSFSEDTPVASHWGDPSRPIEAYVFIDVVYVDPGWKVVGEEQENYRPKEGERRVLRFT